MWQEYRSIIVLGAVLVVLFFSLFACSTRGYGYMGHGGYDSGPSSLYWGGSGHYYPSQTVRSGSPGGPSVRGGGFRSGK
jgi:hypothetical protein